MVSLAEQYLDIACPQCHRKLRIRREHAGRTLACNTCSHAFASVPGSAPSFELDETPQMPPRRPRATEKSAPESAVPQKSRLELELEQVRAELALREMELTSARRSAEICEEELAQAKQLHAEQQRLIDDFKRDRDAALAKAGTLGGYMELAERRTTELNTLRVERSDLQNELAALRTQLEAARARLVDQERQLQRQFQEFKDRDKALREEFQQSTCLEAKRTEALLHKCTQLAEERDHIDAKAKRREQELQSQINELIASQKQMNGLAAELQEARAGNDQLRNRIADQEAHFVLEKAKFQRQLQLANGQLEVEKQQLQKEHRELKLLADRFRSHAVVLHQALETELRGSPKPWTKV